LQHEFNSQILIDLHNGANCSNGTDTTERILVSIIIVVVIVSLLLLLLLLWMVCLSWIS